jgi:pimeloyl-ACP methyl ester carboxylesterase
MVGSAVTTSDGVRLRVSDTGGGGIPLVMLHGWGQTAALFQGQLSGLGDSRRVIAYDMRGHGLSDKPDHGYRIARLAADLRDVLDALGIEQADLLGWSMGASVIWSYLELFGSARVRSLVLVDQPAAVIAWPWTTAERSAETGAILPIDGLTELAASIAADANGEVVQDFVRSMFSEPVDEGVWRVVSEQIRQTPVHAAVPLLIDHAAQDWTDVLGRIDVPALVIGCEGSHVGVRSQRELAARIPGARVHVFGREAASSHFPFLEATDAFNGLVDAFLCGVARDASTGVETRGDTRSQLSRPARV